MELRFLRSGCLQSDSTWQPISTAADRWADQFLPLIMPTTFWIETHQPWAKFVIHQSLTTTAVKIFRLSKSILSPDEDLQAVETSRSIKVTIVRRTIKLNLYQDQEPINLMGSRLYLTLLRLLFRATHPMHHGNYHKCPCQLSREC